MTLLASQSVAPLALCWALAAADCLAQAGAAAPAKPGYQEALARYETCMARLPFWYHTEGRSRLAQTQALDGLHLLANDYSKTTAYTEHARYTLATLFGRHFSIVEATDVLERLRLAHDKPGDTWLWVKALRIKIDRIGDADAINIALEAKNVLHRAAAIAALGESSHGNLKAVIVPTCLTFPKGEADRYVLLGAMSGALIENRRRVNDSDYREALTAYISLLGNDVGLPHTAEVQIARHLQKILRGSALFVDPEPWLELLQRGDVKQPSPTRTTAAPRFFGVETEGERLCYVVDMSDSMCKPIDPATRPPAAAVTGPRVKKKRELLDESDLPWHKIETRWDLAREHLRIALLRLSPDKHFAVVWFGTESGTLNSCKGMIKATKVNVDRVLAELDTIKPGPKDEQVAPDGKLRGRTNLHSGLRRAFGLAGKGFIDQFAYVDPLTLTEGCDTIFLLSDGDPSWDDFPIEDKNYREMRTIVDTEYAAPAPDQQRITYYGPYVDHGWIVDDTKRMNAFRRISLHCIGLGEANEQLLSRLAEVGGGEAVLVGQRKSSGKDAGGAKK